MYRYLTFDLRPLWNVMIQFTTLSFYFQSRKEKEILGTIGTEMPPSL